MNFAQLTRNYSGPTFCLTLTAALSACSSKSDPPAGAGGGGNQLVGTFQVQVLGDDTDPSTGMTKVVGQVGDSAVPASTLWTVTKREGDCRLETPTLPFCEPACGADVCVADGVCQAYPTAHSVGDVTLSGANVTGGGSVVKLKEIVKAYQLPAGTTLVYPPFAAHDDVTLHATGGDYTAFDLAAKGVDPLLITSTDFELDTNKPLAISWVAAADPKASQIYLKLDISHHGGGIKGMIECDTDDSGALTISAEMVSELIGLGVAGFPNVVMLRESLDTAPIAPGRVMLEVSSRAERPVTVKGVDSCNADGDCPAGETCQMDSTCAK
ncbi:MAG TPA: hypothetical protein VNG33_09455 [Polyangiaceae bacterium]|nr:hypothetical protein [Polyangiaceae bacterium]